MQTATSSGTGNIGWEIPFLVADNENTYRNFRRKMAADLGSSQGANNITVGNSVSEAKYERAKKRVEKLCQNTDDADAPNEIAKDLAIKILELCKEVSVFPSIINASGDESLLFEFFINENYYLIEIYNSGELIYLPRLNGESKPSSEITFEELKEIVKTI